MKQSVLHDRLNAIACRAMGVMAVATISAVLLFASSPVKAQSASEIDAESARIAAEAEKELAKSERAATKRCALPVIGTPKRAALAAVAPCWGEPTDTNRTITAGHISEQVVFNTDGYLYFDDNVLTSIQTHNH